MHIHRNGSQPSSQGPAAYFTGHVRVDPIFEWGEPTRLSSALVTFEPGATATTGMSHIAIQEWQGGTPVAWMEKVSDAEYLASLG